MGILIVSFEPPVRAGGFFNVARCKQFADMPKKEIPPIKAGLPHTSNR